MKSRFPFARTTRRTFLLALILIGKAEGAEFLDVIQGIMSQKEILNSQIQSHEKKGLSMEAVRLESSAWPQLGLSAFGREYYLQQPQLNSGQYGILTSQNVFGTGFSVDQDLMGLLTRGYAGVREPMERTISLTTLDQRMARTEKYLRNYIDYLIHLRQLDRATRAIHILKNAEKYKEVQEKGAEKLAGKILFSSAIKQNELTVKTENLICKRYESYLSGLELRKEVSWAQNNASTIDLIQVSKELIRLHGIKDYKKLLRARLKDTLAAQLNADRSSSFLDNIDLRLDFNADVYGDSLSSEETSGKVAIEYLFNDPDRMARSVEREDLEARKMKAEYADISEGDEEVNQTEFSEMKDKDLTELAKSIRDQENNFEGMFKLSLAGAIKRNTILQCVSAWSSSANQAEGVIWERVIEMLVSHQYAEITGE